MKERWSHLLSEARTHRTIPVFETWASFVRALRPSDKLIAGILGAFVILTSTLGLYALARSVMVEVPAPGGSFTEGIVGSPRFANPLLALSDADRDLVALTYAGLMGRDADGNLVPVLAESYEVSEDGKTYTFTLRENAKFSDGTPVTAEDVVFTVERAQDPDLKSPQLANWANIAVTAHDAHTVEFRLPRAYAPFLQDTTLGILPAHRWRTITNEEFPFSTLNTEPVGAGPFKVTRVMRDREGLIVGYQLTAFKDYAPGRPYLSGIRLSFFDTQEELRNALRVGSVDSAYGVPAAHALRAPYARVFGVFFNAAENKAFAQLPVRQALSVAVDRTRITDEVLGGYATPVAGPVPAGSGIEELPIPPSEGRLEEARALLEDAGWTFNEETGLWTHEEEELELSVTLRTSNVPELKAVADSVKNDWQALGVPVTLELYEASSLTQSVIRPRSYQALLFGMVVGRDRDLFAFWSSSERNDPGLNIALYANRTVDELLEEIRTSQDPEVVAASLAEVNELIAADYPAAFTHSPDFVYIAPRGMKGVVLPQITAPSDRFATIATWHRYTQAVWPFLQH